MAPSYSFSASSSVSTHFRNNAEDISSNAHGSQQGHSGGRQIMSEHNNEPFFVTKEAHNVTAPLGGMAYLQCRIQQLGDRVVSLNLSLISFFFLILLTN